MNFLTRSCSMLHRWLLAVMLVATCSLALADDVLVLRDGKQSYPVNRYLGVVEDLTGNLALKDVLPGPRAPAFNYPETDALNFGFANATLWARFDLVNRHSTVSEWFLEFQYPTIDSVELFVDYADGRLATAVSGDSIPFAARPIKHRFPVFRIVLRKDEQATVYLRVRSQGAKPLPLVMRSGSELHSNDHDEQYLLGIYYGVLLALFIYNWMLYLSLRDRNYLYCSMYIGSWAMLQLIINGLAFEYLWPASPRWANLAVPVFLGVTISSTALFFASFLDVQRVSRRLAFAFKCYLVFGLLVIAAGFVVPYAVLIKIAQLGALTECLFMLFAGLFCLKFGSKQAGYVVLGWAMLLTGAVLYLAQNAGLMHTVFITEYGMQLGSAVQVLLFSVALARRTKAWHDERRSIERVARDSLEQRLQQRTLELDGALANLDDAHRRLRDLGRIDGLTGVKNRACFNEQIAMEWQRGMRGKQSLAVLMIDIDLFKKINERFGHLSADMCLKEVAHALALKVHRIGDDVFRFGGEQFVVILPNTDLPGAVHLAEVMRNAVETLNMAVDGNRIPLSVSIGVACMTPGAGGSFEALVGSAGKALNEAKLGGRNRVSSAAPLAAKAPLA